MELYMRLYSRLQDFKRGGVDDFDFFLDTLRWHESFTAHRIQDSGMILLLIYITASRLSAVSSPVEDVVEACSRDQRASSGKTG